MGYISEEEDDDDDGEFVSEDNGTEIEDATNTDDDIENLANDSGYFMLGMTFANVKEAREAIHEYGVKFGYKLKFVKNDTTRVRVHCGNELNCPFKLFISKDGEEGGFVVKTATLEHCCFRQSEVPSASQHYIAKIFKDTIYKIPKFRAKDMQLEIKKHLKQQVNEYKCKRAKKQILHELQRSFKQEFANLGAYAEILKKSNPGSKCEIQLSEEGLENGKRIFRRIFVMMDACRRNWLDGCRPIISLDGCFLKGVVHGMLLTAVGKDANDQIVPIAWAVISKENKVNWSWFLCWLRQELELDDGSRFTIISDMQKGLIDAVNMTLPKAEHRWCARHIYANWSKKWSGGEIKNRFWICAWSTFEEDFKVNLSKIGEVHKKATKDLLKYHVHTWCRAYQSNRSCSFMVDNNISESFNSSILDTRQKPIVSMLKDIRVMVMTRIKCRKNLCDSWIGEWSPAAMKIYQDAKEAAIGCKVLWNGASGYEIGEGEDKHTILLHRNICTCRVWELTGIPCCHVIAAMYYSKIDHISMISIWYHKSTYQKAYEFPILPVPGIKFFNTEGHASIEPPPSEKLPSRPRKKRVRAPNEPKSSGNTLSRKGQIQRCSICKSTGHNKKNCPQEASQLVGNSNSSTTSRPKKMVPQRQFKASKTSAGVGCHVDLSSGQIIIDPGLSSERVIMEGEQYFIHNSDPIVRGPIPNEREINRTKRKLRSISFSEDGSKVRQATSLPFKPPGLQWNGELSITTRQLLEKRETMRSKRGKHEEIRGESASTTN